MILRGLASAIICYAYSQQARQKSFIKQPLLLFPSLSPAERIITTFIPSQPDYDHQLPSIEGDIYRNSKRADLQKLRTSFQEIYEQNVSKKNAFVLVQAQQDAISMSLGYQDIGKLKVLEPSSQQNNNRFNTKMHGRYFFSRTLELEVESARLIESQSTLLYRNFISTGQLHEYQQALLKAGCNNMLMIGLPFESQYYDKTVSTLKEFQRLYFEREGGLFPVALLPNSVFEKEALVQGPVNHRLLKLSQIVPINQNVFDGIQIEQSLRIDRKSYQRYKIDKPLTAENMLKLVIDPKIPCFQSAKKPPPQLLSTIQPPNQAILMIYSENCLICKAAEKALLKMKKKIPVLKMHYANEGRIGMPTFTPLMAVIKDEKVCCCRQLTLKQLTEGALQKQIQQQMTRCQL